MSRLILLCELQANERPSKTSVEAGEVVQRLREGAALPEDPGPIPSFTW